ncbi:hypothetical protein WG66_014605 [Moniliophthora roreri]|nr:hypothetical protein WG66_014605 [Moniliophthora roreri]
MTGTSSLADRSQGSSDTGEALGGLQGISLSSPNKPPTTVAAVSTTAQLSVAATLATSTPTTSDISTGSSRTTPAKPTPAKSYNVP